MQKVSMLRRNGEKYMPTRKEQCIEQIKKVKAAHLNLMNSIDFILNGVDTKYHEPLNKYECEFGKWFYTSDLAKIILGPQIYEKLEHTHTQWHQIYAKIYNLLFPKKRGVIGKLFQAKPKPQDIDKAKAYYDDLKKLTNELVHELEIAQKRAQALSDSKFDD